MDKKDVEYALQQVKEIKGAHTFYDIHAHPFEIMDGPIDYSRSADTDGLFSSVSTDYSSPSLTNLDLDEEAKQAASHNGNRILNKVMQLNRRRLYSHAGPKVFCDHMDLSGIDVSVLLPVAADSQSAVRQLQQLSDMFAADSRFLLGYCVPNDISTSQIDREVKRVASLYNVAVLKIHPGFQGIDPATTKGKDRIESILVAANESQLKVVIHGGLSPSCYDQSATAYASVANLMNIDWSITSQPVVVAHAGSYGYQPSEVKTEVIPILIRTMSLHSNLAVDTSALHLKTLSLLFQSIDTNRICFGSDALYEKQWIEMVKVWCALKQSVPSPEHALIKVASKNPEALLFDTDTCLPLNVQSTYEKQEKIDEFKPTTSL